MRSLFFKIFLWFVLSNFVIGLSVFLIGAAIGFNSDHRRGRHPLEGLLESQAQAAATIYENEGSAALRDYLGRVQIEPESSFYLFAIRQGRVDNQHALNLLKNPPPLAIQAVALDASLGRGSRWLPTEKLDRGARRIVTARGTPFVFALEIPRPQHGPDMFSDLRDPLSGGALRVIAGALVIVLVCYGLARYLTAPAVKLRHATQQLAAGDLSARVGAQMGRRRDELADLGRDFDQMAERIENLVQGERQLLGNISHELRSPLARLSVAVDMIERKPETTDKYLPRIRREAERLNLLIGQLLALKKLESGTANAPKASVDLRGIVRDIVQDADFEAHNFQRAVHLAQEEDCVVQGDEELLRSAIENVVRNAVRYTYEDSTVEVRLSIQESEAMISVCDCGPGVPEDALENIFRPFYRVADARDRRSGGTGLGLAITQQAVRWHGGKVSASNEPEGGLCIKISLPLPAV